MDGSFDVARCPCGEVVCDGLFTGVVRLRCRGCKRRIWIVADGERVRVGLVDAPPVRMIVSA